MNRYLWPSIAAGGLLLAALALLLVVQPVAAQEICFPEQPTFPCLTEPFASYWQGNGGLAVFGYPLSARPAKQAPN
ncbi:MAG: hypothetical protein HC876_06825 [Chloroflexaceae bacterium]|nr:hypothetical protein [Chloroflexaceae bacterium]